MTKLTTRAYLEAQGCSFKDGQQSLVSLCPFHHELHPSLHLYEDGHYYCFSCNTWGTLFGAINFFEFGNRDIRETWNLVYKRARELNGGEPLPQQKERPYNREYQPPPGPTEEEIAMMTAAMRWWHAQLWSQDAWAQSARGHDAFENRGVVRSTQWKHVQIGWAPPYEKESYNQMFLSFSAAMRRACGINWQPLARKIGLLWERSGTLAITDRMMLCCVNEQGQCIFFQGRAVINPERDPVTGKYTYPKYTSPWKIRKAPFTLPITGQTRIPGIVHTESFFGPAVLEKYAIRGCGWAGMIPSWYDEVEIAFWNFLARLMEQGEIHWLGHDNDSAHTDRHGNIYYPGDKQAEALSALFDKRGKRNVRIRPSKEAKDVDTWVRFDVAPLLEATQPYLEQWNLLPVPA